MADFDIKVQLGFDYSVLDGVNSGIVDLNNQVNDIRKSVVQTTGNNPTLIMSQKAATDAINKRVLNSFTANRMIGSDSKGQLIPLSLTTAEAKNLEGLNFPLKTEILSMQGDIGTGISGYECALNALSGIDELWGVPVYDRGNVFNIASLNSGLSYLSQDVGGLYSGVSQSLSGIDQLWGVTGVLRSELNLGKLNRDLKELSGNFINQESKVYLVEGLATRALTGIDEIWGIYANSPYDLPTVSGLYSILMYISGTEIANLWSAIYDGSSSGIDNEMLQNTTRALTGIDEIWGIYASSPYDLPTISGINKMLTAVSGIAMNAMNHNYATGRFNDLSGAIVDVELKSVKGMNDIWGITGVLRSEQLNIYELNQKFQELSGLLTNYMEEK